MTFLKQTEQGYLDGPGFGCTSLARVESRVCVQISGEDSVWYVCDVLYAVLYVGVSCFVVRGCADHLKFCVVCINGQRYVCCSECNVVSIECNSGAHHRLG